MHKFILFILLISIFQIHAQKKNTYYFDNELNDLEISNIQFHEKAKNDQYIAQKFEIDTAFIAVIFPIKSYGTLNKIQMSQLSVSLNKDTNITFDPTKITVIHFYPGATLCNSAIEPNLWRHNTNDDTYFKKINKIAPVQVFFMFKNDDLLKDSYKRKFDWFKDKDRVVENLFFKYVFPCGSFVVIASSGEYIVRHSEYSKKMVLEITKELNAKLN